MYGTHKREDAINIEVTDLTARLTTMEKELKLMKIPINAKASLASLRPAVMKATARRQTTDCTEADSFNCSSLGHISN